MAGQVEVMDGRTEELLIGLKEAPKWVLEKVALWGGGGGG